MSTVLGDCAQVCRDSRDAAVVAAALRVVASVPAAVLMAPESAANLSDIADAAASFLLPPAASRAVAADSRGDCSPRCRVSATCPHVPSGCLRLCRVCVCVCVRARVMAGRCAVTRPSKGAVQRNRGQAFRDGRGMSLTQHRVLA